MGYMARTNGNIRSVTFTQPQGRESVKYGRKRRETRNVFAGEGQKQFSKQALRQSRAGKDVSIEAKEYSVLKAGTQQQPVKIITN
jgi:hypothetical protein